MNKKLRFLLIVISFTIIPLFLKAQCSGSWTNATIMNYKCANGPFLSFNLGTNVCPVSPQATYTYYTSKQLVKLNFSAFGTLNATGSSRMAVFLNGSLIDLSLACNIFIGCQTPGGIYSINNGCLVDSIAGADGGLAGFIILSAAAFGLDSINSIGVAVSEPYATGTIFETSSCDSLISFIELGNDTTLCEGTIFDIGTTMPNAFYLWQDGSITPTYAVSQEGTYWVTVNVNNCGNTTDSININYNQFPNNNASINGATITATQSGAIYQWLNCNGNTPIIGQTNQDFTPTSNGNYSVIVTQNNCSDTSNCFNIISTNIEKINSESFLDIFPNPFSSETTITFSHEQKNTLIQILNFSGKDVRNFTFTGLEFKLQKDELDKGLYFLHYSNENNIGCKKIVIR